MTGTAQSDPASTGQSDFPLIFVPIGIAAILAYNWLSPKWDRYNARVDADSLASPYLAHMTKASKGDPESKKFIEAANRRLEKIKDDARLGDTSAKLFLEALRARGINP